MEQGGIYTWWHYFRKGEVGGQVATLITLAIAIIFLFVAITLNISRVSQKKTATSQAADGAAVKLASYIGSYANQLSWRYLKGGTEKCQKRWGTFWKILAAVVLVVIAVLTGNPQVALLAKIGAVVSGTSAALNEFVFEPKIAERIQRQLNKLALKDNLTEQAIMHGLRNSVDDPAKVADIHDYDEDGDTTDKISRFSAWYTERANALTNAQQANRAKVAGFIPQLEEFAQKASEFRQGFSEDITRPLEAEDDCPECKEEDLPDVFAEKDGEFITLLEKLQDEGLDVSFWVKDVDPNNEQTYDQVDELSGDLNSFYLWAEGETGGLLKQDFDNIVRTDEMWMNQLYTPENPDPEEEGKTWYETWEEQIARIDHWRPELYGVITELGEMIEEEADPARQDYLRDLQNQVSTAISTLDNFQDTLGDFNNNLLVFYQESRAENYAQKNAATYSWHDSLGWHHVRVEVSQFKMPYLKVKKKTFKICLYLKNHSGNLRVTVTRFDEAQAASFARRGSTPLWKFRYVKDAQAQERLDPANPEQALAYGITSEATARYSFNSLPRLVRVR